LFGAQNRRAAPWKGMQVLQGLLAGQDPQQEELLRAALQLATRRVVFKRPAKGKVIEIQGARPSLQVRAKALRFDVYLRQG
ncbi:MAG: class I SAM-dependent methyltransferase, partial [Desulfohalobiaceae bacterium]